MSDIIDSISLGGDCSVLIDAYAYDSFLAEMELLEGAERCKHVYACVGLCLSLVHQLEVTLGTIAVAHERLAGKIAWRHEAEEFDARFSRRTLGAMLHDVRSRVQWSEHFENLFCNALAHRNNIAHGFFAHHAVEMMSVEGQRSVVAKLARTAQLVSAADAGLSLVMKVLMKSMGVSADIIEREMTALLTRAAELDSVV